MSAAATVADLDPVVLGDLEHELWLLLRRVRRNVAERAQAVEPGLTALGYGVLDQLLRDGSGRAADIGCTVGADKGAMSRTVHQLVDLGLVERTVDPEDARALVLSLSEHGRDRMREVTEHRRARFLGLMSGWTNAELSDLVAGLTRYNATVEAAVASAD
ncbi:MarR family winged helix-turn-helix transcriptional regulator [Nocardioides zeae]|uniref:MarR family winged helix-turn-helix transcriptional regulator n=1 Tax=Nocardioides imazamoxiresistens TaxID=3231893 RepID=A0ABU3PY01_9ACTN|nr:MarR family winged helix-turn-helix transcriptional regulator [Nocardioides zeae]MDT9594130.1 MarR family winged helix-turn-helix transcriptional regulator [Nocardioides zeae]